MRDNQNKNPMRIATWNLDHRLGTQPCRLEAADAAIALDADAVFFTEYFPRGQEPVFLSRLARRGWSAQVISLGSREPANRVLGVSRVPMKAESFARPSGDTQFAANVLRVRFPGSGLRVLALRVPAYDARQHALTEAAWDWIEAQANALAGGPAAILGDFNAGPDSPRHRGGDHLRRIVATGWQLATPQGASYYGLNGRTRVIDHLLASPRCAVSRAAFVAATGSHELAGSPSALSDHAALVAVVGCDNGWDRGARSALSGAAATDA